MQPTLRTTVVLAALGASLALCRCGSSAFSSSSSHGADGGDDASDSGSELAIIVGGGDSIAPTDGHPGDGPGISCDAATAIACNGVCVDKETDPANCGSCGHACAGPEAGMGTGSCVNGTCGVSCQAEAGTTLYCASTGDCVDPTSTANCGTCGHVCYGPEAGPGHAACQPGGMCAVACDSDAGEGGVPDILCSGSCVSPDDVNHCGTCTACAGPPSGHGSPTCPAAQCVMTCLTGYHPSGMSCNADCTLTAADDPSTDPCVVADGLGIFVSPTGSDSSPADGTKEHPFGTIGHAMDTAENAGKRVYACGTFAGEQLVVGASRDGVSVYGGFDCTTWAYNASTKAKLAPTAAGFALTVNGLTTGVTFEDFEFDSIAAPASVATGAAASSVAVIVNGSAGVVFRRVAMSAGAGQTGGSGTNGSNSWTLSAATGNPASGSAGGPPIACSCGGGGGQGGAAGVLNVGTSQFTPGSDGQDGVPLGIADHGTGSTTATAACSAGNPAGSGGSNGTGGLGGAGTGSIAYPAGWSNAALGGTGGNGTFAQGGGGGGGHYYVAGTTPSGAGGGGGCGGCGGAPGTGGLAGGSSIALITVASAVTLDTCVLTAAAGGAGGQGGNGLGGQPGGGGGSGDGSGSCSGGPGGQGGEGGAGGGGVGGNSLAIAYSGTAPAETGTVTHTFATSAALGGSPGGGNSTAASQGNSGLFQAKQSF